MANNEEANYFKFVALALLFLLLAFDRDLSMIYFLIMVGDYIWWKSSNFQSFRMSLGRHTRFKVYLESLAAFGIFLFISSFLVSVFQPQALQAGQNATQSVFHLLSTTTPLLQGSQFLTFIGWVILVPIIETRFFNGRLLEGFSAYGRSFFGANITYSLKNKNLWFVMIFVAALFTLFHITSKGLSSLPLLITFIFSLLSSILVIRHRELKGAILLHILTNGLAVSATFGWI